MALRDDLQHTLGAAYTLERELGGGGMSRVFVAEEKALGRKVVVKVLPPEIAAGVSSDRFKREIQMAARLQHPHIPRASAAGPCSPRVTPKSTFRTHAYRREHSPGRDARTHTHGSGDAGAASAGA